jgi:hypothetical protein
VLRALSAFFAHVQKSNPSSTGHRRTCIIAVKIRAWPVIREVRRLHYLCRTAGYPSRPPVPRSALLSLHTWLGSEWHGADEPPRPSYACWYVRSTQKDQRALSLPVPRSLSPPHCKDRVRKLIKSLIDLLSPDLKSFIPDGSRTLSMDYGEPSRPLASLASIEPWVAPFSGSGFAFLPCHNNHV